MVTQSERQPVRIGTGMVIGVDAVPVTIQATMDGDGHGVRLLGAVDRVVRESFHRVLSAFAASDLASPRGRPVVNFAPADLPKSGSAFDLPLALALAGAGGVLPGARLGRVFGFGELDLDGTVRGVRGVVPVALAAREAGAELLITGPRDAALAAAVPGLCVLAAPNLAAALAHFRDAAPLTPIDRRDARSLLAADRTERASTLPDFADLRGHEVAKRALCIAAAGRHNVLLIGPPGSGKSALIRRVPAILDAPTDDECLDILRIRSAGADGSIGNGTLDGTRPFRAPHHSSSTSSLLGGGGGNGTWPRPGEVTLAHHGVLFLDELPEYRREALEGLRQPLEDRSITIGRAARTVTFPSDFVLLAAMNPCPCGYLGDARQACRCGPRERHSYRARISGPLLDRFDLIVPVPAVEPAAFDGPADPAWSTEALRAAVRSARGPRERRRSRVGDGQPQRDAREGRALEEIADLDEAGRDAMARVTRLHRFGGRARTRTLRLARTLADLADRDRVAANDIFEAACLRGGSPESANGSRDAWTR